MFDKRCLDSIRFIRSSETFDSRDLLVCRVNRQDKTRVRRFTVDKNRAGSARPHIADEFGSRDRRIKMIAKCIKECCPRFDLHRSFLTVNV